MSFTVVPLHNLNLPVGSRIPFGKKFVLQDVPEWLKKDTGFLNDIARHDWVGTLEAKHALVSEYGAASIGEPDPEWKGQKRDCRPAGLCSTLLQCNPCGLRCYS